MGESCNETGCGSGLSCLADFPGGFCTRECGEPGDGAGCPQDTLCISQFDELICAPVCTSSTNCREGYECLGESGSSVRACRVSSSPGGQSRNSTPAQPVSR